MRSQLVQRRASVRCLLRFSLSACQQNQFPHADKRVKEGQGTSGLSPLGDVEVHPKTSPEVQLIHGEPFTERKSTFQVVSYRTSRAFDFCGMT